MRIENLQNSVSVENRPVAAGCSETESCCLFELLSAIWDFLGKLFSSCFSSIGSSSRALNTTHTVTHNSIVYDPNSYQVEPIIPTGPLPPSGIMPTGSPVHVEGTMSQGASNSMWRNSCCIMALTFLDVFTQNGIIPFTSDAIDDVIRKGRERYDKFNEQQGEGAGKKYTVEEALTSPHFSNLKATESPLLHDNNGMLKKGKESVFLESSLISAFNGEHVIGAVLTIREQSYAVAKSAPYYYFFNSHPRQDGYHHAYVIQFVNIEALSNFLGVKFGYAEPQFVEDDDPLFQRAVEQSLRLSNIFDVTPINYPVLETPQK
jgi:hypothetical protein